MKLKVVAAALLIVGVALIAYAQAGHSVALTWIASPTQGVTYNVDRSSTSGGPYSQINTSPVTGLTFTDTQVSSGATYYYVVRAFDGTSESANSNEVKAVIPQGPQPPSGLTATVK